ncbi:hypothetical protein [Paraliomyxa miuraensis]|uniref:hypothetical protein n=1 Tax=Paraliomyxa miuraensis TaxID=376150 RepID=UPI0022550A75|nr:hypothetical protein [Paraliomyxa miuraensis]MCX4242574.1 hypothetical protein [Paraliomyxa miuraensis]
MLLIGVVLGGLGCGDDTTMSTTGLSGMPTSGEDSTATLTTFDATDSSSSGVADSTESASSGSTTGDDTTGGEPIPGQTASQLVTAGQRSSSAGYSVVYTFGQPSPLQSTHTSANYRVQAGLAGANGSPP